MSVASKVEEPKVGQHETLYLSRDNQRTFQQDNDLPSLPVPPLGQTLQRYLRSVRPHLTEEEYEATREMVTQFEAGVGPDLQQKLLERAATRRNWLEDWWLHYGYLRGREPLLPTMNTAGPHPFNFSSFWGPSVDKAATHGSLFLWGYLKFYDQLREERFKPHKGRDGKNLSMHQFRWMFNGSRIPGVGADSLFTAFKTKAEGDCPNHLVTLCNGHIWTFVPMDAAGQPLNPPELEVQIRYMRETSEALGRGPCLATLTCDQRDSWAKNRAWLQSLSLNNTRNLHHIESAMCVFVLDNSEPDGPDEILWESLCGDTSNRWADKSLSAIMTKNGLGFMNNDHTPYDAMASVILGHYQQLLLEDMGGRWTGPTEVRDLAPPTLLHFDLDAKLLNAIQAARELSLSYVNNCEVKGLFFREYGREFLKPFKLHPDAFVQMALQLAYFTLHHKLAPTYETATTRRYYHGRTETVRSCTLEALAFTRTMRDPSASVAERRHRLVAAVNQHVEQMSQCQKNEGVDRHLFGLYVTALESGLDPPALFTDPAFIKSGGGGNYVLSTSTVGYTAVFGGVSAMTPDGYGVFYSMEDHIFNFFVSCYKSSEETSGEAFVATLVSVLREMREVVTTPTASL